jgi:hypothetical protein
MPKKMLFTCEYMRRPWKPFSRPMPLALKPPKAVAMCDCLYVLIQTEPA